MQNTVKKLHGINCKAKNVTTSELQIYKDIFTLASTVYILV